MAKGNFFPSLNVGHFVTGAMAILAATGMLIHNRGHGARAGPGWAVLGPHRSCVLLLGFHTISHLARDMKDVSHVTRLPAPALAIIIIITCDRVRHSEYKSSAAWEQSVTRAMCQARLIFKLSSRLLMSTLGIKTFINRQSRSHAEASRPEVVHL